MYLANLVGQQVLDGILWPILLVNLQNTREISSGRLRGEESWVFSCNLQKAWILNTQNKCVPKPYSHTGCKVKQKYTIDATVRRRFP